MRRLVTIGIICLLLLPSLSLAYLGNSEIKGYRDFQSASGQQELVFCAQHIAASEHSVTLTNGTYDIPFLEMLMETGIDCVRLSIYPYNYVKYEQRYENLIAKIRENGLKLMVAYMVGDIPQGTITSFTQYKEIELNFTQMFVEKYKPDYYAVVTEPMTMEKRIKLDFSDEQWIELVEEAVNLVKSISPETKTVASVDKRELELSKKFALIENLDIMSFQLYGWAGMYKRYKGWLGKGDVVGEAIEFAKQREKDVFITETWLTIEDSLGFCYPWRTPFDAMWMRFIVYYAQKHGVKGVSPFFTNLFVCYPATNNLEIAVFRSIRALENGRRTLPFYAYKRVIEKNKIESVEGLNINNLSIVIKKPKEGYLYIADRKIIPTILGNTMVTGWVTVEAEVESENRIEKVRFYVNDELKSVDYDEPYQWLWNEKSFGRHVLKVEAYDEKGNIATDEIDAIIFNWHFIPIEYRKTYFSLEKTLRDFDAYLNFCWNGEKYNVSFGANLLPANLHAGEDMLNETYYNKTVAYLEALKSLGAKEIHIDIGYPLLSPDYPDSDKYLKFYKSIAQEIRKRGLKFHAEFEFAIPDYYYNVSYENFTREKIKEIMLYYANLICNELKPDYYTIIDEPTTQNQRFNLSLTVEDWTEIVSFVKDNLNCSDVLIGAGGGTWEEEFIKSFARNIELDFINIHLYGVDRNSLYKAVEIAEFVRLEGKKTAIGETWLHSGGQDSSKDKWRYSDVFSFWQPLDADFMKILVKLAHYQKLEFIDPFFTNYFFVYLDYNEVMRNKEKYMPPEKGLKIALEKAIDNANEGIITKTGLAYKEMIGGGE